jgi:hypothetical protein
MEQNGFDKNHYSTKLMLQTFDGPVR